MSRPGGKNGSANAHAEGAKAITINISVPRTLHRRVSITCAVLDVSLKEATNRALAAWVEAHADRVAQDVGSAAGAEEQPT